MRGLSLRNLTSSRTPSSASAAHPASPARAYASPSASSGAHCSTLHKCAWEEASRDAASWAVWCGGGVSAAAWGALPPSPPSSSLAYAPRSRVARAAVLSRCACSLADVGQAEKRCTRARAASRISPICSAEEGGGASEGAVAVPPTSACAASARAAAGNGMAAAEAEGAPAADAAAAAGRASACAGEWEGANTPLDTRGDICPTSSSSSSTAAAAAAAAAAVAAAARAAAPCRGSMPMPSRLEVRLASRCASALMALSSAEEANGFSCCCASALPYTECIMSSWFSCWCSR